MTARELVTKILNEIDDLDSSIEVRLSLKKSTMNSYIGDVNLLEDDDYLLDNFTDIDDFEVRTKTVGWNYELHEPMTKKRYILTLYGYKD